jgi:hypothetical protein
MCCNHVVLEAQSCGTLGRERSAPFAHATSPAVKPCADQGGLAITGGCADQSQRALTTLVQALHQPRAFHQITGEARPVQLGLQEELVLVFHDDMMTCSGL